MIYSLNGNLLYNDTSYIVIECGGVGFKCFTSVETSKKLGPIGNSVFVYTYLSVREDSFDLFAFSTKDELEVFKLLIGVSGVGPKAAISILSILDSQHLVLAIASGDVNAITRANGVGKKSAERIILELKDKITNINNDYDDIAVDQDNSTSQITETIEALVALGYSRSDAAKAVSKLDKKLSTDEMLRAALRNLSKNL